MSDDEHICTECYAPSHEHSEDTDIGRHWPPLCCPGCECRSFEDADQRPIEDGVCALCDDFDEDLARDVARCAGRNGIAPGCPCAAYQAGYQDGLDDAEDAEALQAGNPKGSEGHG